MLQKISLAFLFIKFKSNHGIENIPLLVKMKVPQDTSNAALQFAEVEAVILLGIENRLTIIAPHNHMLS